MPAGARIGGTRLSPAHAPPLTEFPVVEIAFDERGLVPVVVQDWRTGEVLTLAYANAEAVARTRETGELHLWSRSRGELWHKGATSGNVQRVRALRLDCDGDALLALVEPAGPACHTGERTCFHHGDVDARAPHEALPDLERTLEQRARGRPDGSYTVALLDDPPGIGAKVQEEAEEVARAARDESDDRVDEEGADVLYHLAVLLHSRGRRLADVEEVLDGRRRGARAAGRAVAAGGPRTGARAQPGATAPQLHRRLRDPRLGLPQAPRAEPRAPRLPAGVGRAGPARGPVVVHRGAPAQGAALVAARRRRSVCARARRGRPPPPGAAGRPAALRRRRGRLLRL